MGVGDEKQTQCVLGGLRVQLREGTHEDVASCALHGGETGTCYDLATIAMSVNKAVAALHAGGSAALTGAPAGGLVPPAGGGAGHQGCTPGGTSRAAGVRACVRAHACI